MITLNKSDRALLERITVSYLKENGLERDAVSEKMAFKLFLRHKALTDLFFLGYEILGWKNAKLGKRRRIDPKFHKWLAGKIQLPGDKLILVPRLHLKTTWIKLRIIQMILENPNIRIGLFSVTTNLVEDELADIKRMLDNPILVELFPEIVPRREKLDRSWEKSTHDQLTLKRDPRLGKIPQEPQIRVVGVGSKITGMHFDVAFVDDILDDSTTQTPDAMRKTEAWWAYVQSIFELDCETTMTGTFYHYSDLYNKIIREKQFKHIYIRKAIENGKIIYSSWFTQAHLDRIRKRQGQYIFNCQYLLDPLPDEEKMFPPPHPTYSQLPQGEYEYYIAVDPAATTNKWSDDTGIAIGAVSKGNVLYIVEARGVQMKGNELADELIRLCVKYQPRKIGIELGLQEHLRYIIQAKVVDWQTSHPGDPSLWALQDHTVLSIPISRKQSKAQRINLSLGAFIREGRCFIHESCSELMREMEFFTGKGNEEDNIVDASSMIFSCVDRFAQHYWIKVEHRHSGFTYEDLKKLNRTYEGNWDKRFAV